MLVVFLPAFDEQFAQFCFRVARVQSSRINVAFQIKPQGSGSYSTRPSQRERGWYLKRFSSAKSPSLLSDCSGIWCLPFGDQLSGVFASHTRVKNVINSTALYRGRHLAQKCVLMGYVSVFWVLASYLWPLSSLILPFSNYLSPLFLLSSFLLASHCCSLNDGSQMIIWTGKVEVTSSLKSQLIKWAL